MSRRDKRRRRTRKIRRAARAERRALEAEGRHSERRRSDREETRDPRTRWLDLRARGGISVSFVGSGRGIPVDLDAENPLMELMAGLLGRGGSADA